MEYLLYTLRNYAKLFNFFHLIFPTTLLMSIIFFSLHEAIEEIVVEKLRTKPTFYCNCVC